MGGVEVRCSVNAHGMVRDVMGGEQAEVLVRMVVNDRGRTSEGEWAESGSGERGEAASGVEGLGSRLLLGGRLEKCMLSPQGGLRSLAREADRRLQWC